MVLYCFSKKGSSDGRTDGRTDGRADVRTGGRTDGRAGGRTDGRAGGRAGGLAGGRAGGGRAGGWAPERHSLKHCKHVIIGNVIKLTQSDSSAQFSKRIENNANNVLDHQHSPSPPAPGPGPGLTKTVCFTD